ncbi:hypothetical protein DPMN_021552 [Dreissena polymorpha]|uniref:Uncharacterized protein n=1 Tax=Dreissena polymorpha TaxID=45954 RepID=A0A9D4NP79_DREPO|nr:hypothetical protein DPMN_021552 [Dreissena polymorpha]
MGGGLRCIIITCWGMGGGGAGLLMATTGRLRAWGMVGTGGGAPARDGGCLELAALFIIGGGEGAAAMGVCGVIDGPNFFLSASGLEIKHKMTLTCEAPLNCTLSKFAKMFSFPSYD